MPGAFDSQTSAPNLDDTASGCSLTLPGPGGQPVSQGARQPPSFRAEHQEAPSGWGSMADVIVQGEGKEFQVLVFPHQLLCVS